MGDIQFVTRLSGLRTSFIGEHDIGLSLRGKGTKENPYIMGVVFSLNALRILQNPEYITVGIKKEKNHIRCYFKVTDSKNGFHIAIRTNGTGVVGIPRLDKKLIQELVGGYNLKFSENYNYWYVEKEDLNFVEKR